MLNITEYAGLIEGGSSLSDHIKSLKGLISAIALISIIVLMSEIIKDEKPSKETQLKFTAATCGAGFFLGLALFPLIE